MTCGFVTIIDLLAVVSFWRYRHGTNGFARCSCGGAFEPPMHASMVQGPYTHDTINDYIYVNSVLFP